MPHIYSQIAVLECVDREHVPKPTEELLTAFEKQHSFSLPESYRQFVLQFGGGELAGLWSIASPMDCQHPFELWRFNREHHGNPSVRILETYGPLDFTQAFVFFADDGDYYFGWKRDEVTDAKKNEYAIYKFGYFNDLPLFAQTFEELITLALTPKKDWFPENEFTRFDRLAQ